MRRQSDAPRVFEEGQVECRQAAGRHFRHGAVSKLLKLGGRTMGACIVALEMARTPHLRADRPYNPGMRPPAILDRSIGRTPA